MTIEFCAINKPEDWMEMVAEQFGTSVIMMDLPFLLILVVDSSNNIILCHG